VSNVVQLYRWLLRARTEFPQPESPPTIGDVYQRLVPYRTVRSELGFSELKEYEYALMRLLSGEHGYVTLASEEAVSEIRRELESPNPILGVYRDYAGVEVSIREDATDPLPASPPVIPAWMSAEATDRTLIFDGPVEGGPVASERPDPAKGAGDPVAIPPDRVDILVRPGEWAADPTERAPSGSAGPSVCWACRCAMPPGRSARYCPACGSAQHGTACHACGATIEPRWRFCIDCGTRRLVGDGGGPIEQVP